MWLQKQISLKPKSRGFHLITAEITEKMPQISELKIGLLHVFIQHTSASLTLNENADPTVRTDFRSFVDRLIPEGEAYYEHLDEGRDDMPAHLKSSIVGSSSVSLPITEGRIAAGVWQGVYLCEHRNQGGSRRLLLTLNGEH